MGSSFAEIQFLKYTYLILCYEDVPVIMLLKVEFCVFHSSIPDMDAGSEMSGLRAAPVEKDFGVMVDAKLRAGSVHLQPRKAVVP